MEVTSPQDAGKSPGPGFSGSGASIVSGAGRLATYENETYEDFPSPISPDYGRVLTFGPLLPALARLQWLEELVLHGQEAQWDGVPPEWGQEHAFPRLRR